MEYTYRFIFAIKIAIFAVVNVDKVPVNYIFDEAYWSLILVILESTLTGAVISISFTAVRIFSAGRQVTSLEKKVVEREIIIVYNDREIKLLLEAADKPPEILDVTNPNSNLFL